MCCIHCQRSFRYVHSKNSAGSWSTTFRVVANCSQTTDHNSRAQDIKGQAGSEYSATRLQPLFPNRRSNQTYQRELTSVSRLSGNDKPTIITNFAFFFYLRFRALACCPGDSFRRGSNSAESCLACLWLRIACLPSEMTSLPSPPYPPWGSQSSLTSHSIPPSASLSAPPQPVFR